MATAVEATDPAGFSDRIAPFADLGEMTRMWAVEKYIGHWDGYSGTHDAFHLLPNNYELYSDPAGVFQMIPWGTDQTWDDRSVEFGGSGGVLFDGCRADPSCMARYARALRAVVAEVGAEYDSAATSTAALLKPWQELEQGNGNRHEYSLNGIDAAVQATRHFIAVRPDDLAEYLADVPEVPASQVELSLQPDPIVVGGQATATATATISDPYGNPAFGDAVEFSSTDPGQTLGPVTDHGDGTYTVEITSSTTAGSPTITATDKSVDAELSDTATLTQTAGVAKQIELSLRPDSIVADGRSVSSATATVADEYGNAVAGEALEFSSTDPGQALGPVADNGDGTYKVEITSSTTSGAATITATDQPAALSATATLTQSPVPLIPALPGGPPLVVARPGISPSASIVGKPKRRTRDRTPTFRFRADGPSSGFKCRVDGRRYRRCESPTTFKPLDPGGHSFNVTALDAEGRPGAVAVYRFTIMPAAGSGYRHPS